MIDCFLIVCEPVEHALPHDRHHDLDRVGLSNMGTQYVICLFDGAVVKVNFAVLESVNETADGWNTLPPGVSCAEIVAQASP